MPEERILGQGRYRLGRPLGEGGWGVVWAATDTRLDRAVALKELRRPLYDQARLRFVREARLTAGLEHPHLVRVLDHDPGGPESPPFLVYEYVGGGTLEDRVVRDGPLARAEVLRVAREVGGALLALHEAGVLHRDVKPANILLREDGGTVLADLGLALEVADPRALTPTGQIVGTLAYLPPECWSGLGAGPRADQFALAATLHAIALGEGIYPSADVESAARHLRSGWAFRASDGLRDALGAPAAAALERALAPDPGKRFDTVAGFLAALEGGEDPGEARPAPREVLASAGPAPPPAAPEPAPEPVRRAPRVLAAALGFAAVFALGRLSGSGGPVPEAPAPSTAPAPPRREEAGRAATRVAAELAGRLAPHGLDDRGVTRRSYRDHTAVVITEFLNGEFPLADGELAARVLEALAEAGGDAVGRRRLLGLFHHLVVDFELVAIYARNQHVQLGQGPYDPRIPTAELAELGQRILEVEDSVRAGVAGAPAAGNLELLAARAALEGVVIREDADGYAEAMARALDRAGSPALRARAAAVGLTLIQPILANPNVVECPGALALFDGAARAAGAADPGVGEVAQDLRAQLAYRWMTLVPRCIGGEAAVERRLRPLVEALAGAADPPSHLGSYYLLQMDLLDSTRALLFTGLPPSARPFLRELRELRARWEPATGFIEGAGAEGPGPVSPR